VGLLPDQVPPEGMGVWAPFFGREAYTMTLAARLVQQTGAALRLLWTERLPTAGGLRGARAGRCPGRRPADAAATRCVRRGRSTQAMEAVIRQCPQPVPVGLHRYKQPRRGARAAGGHDDALGARRARRAVAAAVAAAACRPPSAVASGRCCMRWPAAGASRCATWSCACPSSVPPSARPCARALRLAGPQPARAWPALVRQRRPSEALIHVEGDIGLAERSEQPVMWLVPHFMALDVAGAATQLFQTRQVARSTRRRATRSSTPPCAAAGCASAVARSSRTTSGALPLVRAIRKRGMAFFNLPDMDFGRKEPPFVPFFGVPASTLLAPSRMARGLKMRVQPVVAEMLPGGQGWRVRFGDPWTTGPPTTPTWPTRDDERAGSSRRSAATGAVPVGAQALQDAAGGRGVAVRRRIIDGMRLRSPRCTARATTSSCSTPRARRCSWRGAAARLGDRRFGVGADQILVVEPAPSPTSTSATASSTVPAATRSSIAATARAASCAMCTSTG
jgi:lauroyl/myristoyl acyltransferase